MPSAPAARPGIDRRHGGKAGALPRLRALGKSGAATWPDWLAERALGPDDYLAVFVALTRLHQDQQPTAIRFHHPAGRRRRHAPKVMLEASVAMNAPE